MKIWNLPAVQINQMNEKIKFITKRRQTLHPTVLIVKK